MQGFTPGCSSSPRAPFHAGYFYPALDGSVQASTLPEDFPPSSITRQFKVSPACQNESKAFKKPVKQASLLPCFDSTPLFMAEVTGSCLREESRSPVVVTWGQGGTPCLPHTPLLLPAAHVRDLPLRAHTLPGTERGHRRAGSSPKTSPRRGDFPWRSSPASARPQR